MFCKKCNQVMKHVMSFYDGKSYEFHRCPCCWYESKKIPLIFKDKEVNQKKKDIKSNIPKKKLQPKRTVNKKKK